jgi:endonuclease/exonuclease/phosphatase family metal-dependent hydrolase
MKRIIKTIAFLIALALTLTAAYVVYALIMNQNTPAATAIALSPQLADPPPSLADPLTIKVLTYNVWCPPYKSSNGEARLAKIGRIIAQATPDIVGIQEALMAAPRALLEQELENGGLTHRAYFESGRYGSGLLIASRYPLDEIHFMRFSQGGKPFKLQHGDWWAGKGVALVRVALPDGGGWLDFFNSHVHAGYGLAEYDSVRLSNVRELAAYVALGATGTSPAIVLGDMNARPGGEQYRTLVESADLDRAMTIDSELDHIFAVRSGQYHVEVLQTETISATIDVDGQSLPVSDHQGYMSTIRFTPASAQLKAIM